MNVLSDEIIRMLKLQIKNIENTYYKHSPKSISDVLALIFTSVFFPYPYFNQIHLHLLIYVFKAQLNWFLKPSLICSNYRTAKRKSLVKSMKLHFLAG